MRILVLSWRDPKHPLAGGAEQVMHEHMKGWAEAGHEVTFFSSKVDKLPEEEVLDGIKVVRGGHQYIGVQFAAFFYYLKNRENFDFIVDQFHGIPFFTPLYSGKPKLAVIQEAAREVWLLNPLPKPLNWIVGVIGYLGEPLIFKFYKRTPFMTASASARSDLMKLCIPEKNITIVPHGVILSKQVKGKWSKEKVKTLIFLGALTRDKGIEDALDAFKILSKKGKYRFWVVGKGDSSKLKVKSSKLGIKNIKFWGYVSQKKKFELLARAHVMVNPSVREGWGLVNIEANAMGTPVVAYNSPGLVDSVKDGQSGIIVDQNSPSAIAEAVEEVLSDKKLYQKLQKGAVEWSRQFSWEKSRRKSRLLVDRIFSQSYSNK